MSDEYLNSKKNFKPTKTEDYGFFFFPERFGNTHEQPWYKKLIFFGASREGMRKIQCETNVESCLKNRRFILFKKHGNFEVNYEFNVEDPGVKMMVESMKNMGCEPKLLRHFSCEYCETSMLKGGFDPTTNQVIVCYNNVSPTNKQDVAESMIKSLVQSFDYCRAKYDMFNLKHLACTEIRAANLTPCTLMDAIDNKFVSIFNFKNMHKQCVRMKAALSLQLVRNLTEAEANEIVDSVFEKCLKDTAPFDRPILNNYDYERSYKDRYKYDLS